MESSLIDKTRDLCADRQRRHSGDTAATSLKRTWRTSSTRNLVQSSNCTAAHCDALPKGSVGTRRLNEPGASSSLDRSTLPAIQAA